VCDLSADSAEALQLCAVSGLFGLCDGLKHSCSKGDPRDCADERIAVAVENGVSCERIAFIPGVDIDLIEPAAKGAFGKRSRIYRNLRRNLLYLRKPGDNLAGGGTTQVLSGHSFRFVARDQRGI